MSRESDTASEVPSGRWSMMAGTLYNGDSSRRNIGCAQGVFNIRIMNPLGLIGQFLVV